jgi:hypothetical protein
MGRAIESQVAAKTTGFWLIVTVPLLLGSLYTVIYVLLTGDMQPYTTLATYVHDTIAPMLTEPLVS